MKGAANPSPQETVGWAGGSRGAEAQVGEGKGGWLVLVFIPAEPPGLENLSSSQGSITPGLCCVPRALHCRDQGIFHQEVGKTTLAAFFFFVAGSRSRVRDLFPFDSSVVEMVTPLSHIKNETL